jgi:hypothetical protein
MTVGNSLRWLTQKKKKAKRTCHDVLLLLWLEVVACTKIDDWKSDDDKACHNFDVVLFVVGKMHSRSLWHSAI